MPGRSESWSARGGGRSPLQKAFIRAGTLLCLLVTWGATAAALPPTPETVAALSPPATTGRGARVPFVELEAENAVTNGEAIGPDRTFRTLASEASGRRAVRLQGEGR